MIRNTTEHAPDGVLSAYRDNAAVLAGATARRFFPDPTDGVYGEHVEPVAGEIVVTGLGGAVVAGFAAPQHGADAGEEFARVERFDELGCAEKDQNSLR